MSEYVCSNCGKDGIYEVLEAHGSAWREITVVRKDDKPTVDPRGTVEMDYNAEYTPDGFACSECHAEFGSLDRAVRPAEIRFECLACNLWAYYRDQEPTCLDCGSRSLRRVGYAPEIHRGQVAA